MVQRSSTYARSLIAVATVGAVIASLNGLRSIADLTNTGGTSGGGGYNSGFRNMYSQGSSKSTANSQSKENASSSAAASKSRVTEASSSNRQEETRSQSQSSSGKGNVWVPPLDDSSKREEEERRRAEAERMRIEEENRLRKEEEARIRAQEEWNRMEAEKQRLSVEAMERLRQEEALRQQKIEEARINAMQMIGGKETQSLGCTDRQGFWTTDRSACAYDQGMATQEVLDPQIEEAKQQELRRKMVERYVAEEQNAQKQLAISNLTTETLERLVAVRDANLLASAEHQQFLDQSIQWLRGGQEYFAVPGRSEEEITQMTTYLRQIVDYAQRVTDEARAVRVAAVGSLPEIGAIFGRTEKMLNVFPDVLAVLSMEGVPVNQDVISAYGTITTRFAEIRSACVVDPHTCGKLDEVLSGLEKLQAYVLSAINAAGKPDVETTINEIVRARLAQ